MTPIEINTGDMVMVVRPRSDAKGRIGKVVSLEFLSDRMCVLVRFTNSGVNAWFWPEDLTPAPAIDLLGMVDRT